MESNAALCVLNRVFLRKDHGSAKLPNEAGYYSADLKMCFTGIQANEAPIMMLLQEAHNEDRPISEIIYLCSKRCTEAVIPARALAEVDGFSKDIAEDYSAEDFFIDRISHFCKRQGIDVPVFNPLPYDPARPADCLPSLVQFLGKDFRVSIDITGGRRDAVILQALAVQLLKMQSKESSVGSIVYSSFDDKTIVRQNTTFDLIELTGAVESFMRYGRADQVKTFFEARRFISSETLELCRRMSDFSDALSLCQVDDIDAKAKAVQDGMAEAERALSFKLESYRLIATALDALDDPDGWTCEVTIEEALEDIREAGIPVDIEASSEEQLRSNLERARWSFTVVRSELLLHSLFPIMEGKFIPRSDNTTSLILNTIIWCANHQMIQQALCIYRERISECLVDLGFFTPTKHFESLDAEDRRRIVKNLCAAVRVGERMGPRRELFFSDSPNQKDDYRDYFEFNEEKYATLPLVIAWYKYLHGLRNMVMHVDSQQENLGFLFGCRFLGKSPRVSADAEDVGQGIIAALKAIKNPMKTDISKWNEAYRAAKQAQNAGASRPDVAYRSFEPAEGPEKVTNIIQLQLLILECSYGTKTVEWRQFKEWCESSKHMLLDKSRLGIPKEMSLYQGLCEKYPDKFTFEKRDDSIFVTAR